MTNQSLLYCDPSAGDTVRLRYGEAEIKLIRPRADAILAAIDQLTHGQFSGLVLVNQAPSFTMIRVLVTIYNALAYTKHVPVYELTTPNQALGEPRQQLVPQYSGQPNIT